MNSALHNWVKNLTPDKFFRNVVVLAGGTMFSQLLILVTLPLLTYLYTPADFGVFSVYTSFLSIVLVVTSFSYENAIPLPADDKSASGIVKLSLYLCAIVSVMAGGLFYLFHEQLIRLLHAQHTETLSVAFALLFAASLLGAGCYQALSFWSIRKEQFKQISRTKYTQSITQTSTQLLLSLPHIGAMGLMIGDLCGRVMGVWSQWKIWRTDAKQNQFQTTWQDIKEIGYRYRRFPLLSSGSNVLNSLGLFLPNILLAALYGPHEAGLYALAQRILGAPAMLISSSVSQVYLSQFAISMNENPSKVFPLFMRTTKKVFVVGALIIGVVVLFAPLLIDYIFGKNWADASQYLRILSVMFFSQFVANSVGTTINVMERQDLHLYREITRVVLIAAALYLSWFTNQSVQMAVVMLSAAGTLGYILHLALSYKAVFKYRRAAVQMASAGTG